MDKVMFEWDHRKNEKNVEKHGISFFDAQQAFLDPHRIIAKDIEHSGDEARYYCFGKVDGAVMTVRFTYRGIPQRISKVGRRHASKPRESTIANGSILTNMDPFAIVDSRELSRMPAVNF